MSSFLPLSLPLFLPLSLPLFLPSSPSLPSQPLFLTKPYSVVQDLIGLRLTVQPKLASNSGQSSCLSIPNAGFTVMNDSTSWWLYWNRLLKTRWLQSLVPSASLLRAWGTGQAPLTGSSQGKPCTGPPHSRGTMAVESFVLQCLKICWVLLTPTLRDSGDLINLLFADMALIQFQMSAQGPSETSIRRWAISGMGHGRRMIQTESNRKCETIAVTEKQGPAHSLFC